MAYGISELGMQRGGFQHKEKVIIQYNGLERKSVNSDTVQSAYENSL